MTLRAIYGERAFRIVENQNATGYRFRLTLDGEPIAESPWIVELKDRAETYLNRGPNPKPLEWIET